jgi:cell division transport system permease protein
MRALRYFVTEAAASLWRGRRAASMAVLTIAAGLFVLGFFLVVTANLQRVIAQWGETAELSVYLREEATAEEVDAVRQLVDASGVAAGHQYVSADEAAARFRQDFPDLAASVSRLERNPFPASVDVRLRSVAGVDEGVGQLVTVLEGHPAVVDVQYDRRWLQRLDGILGFVRTVGLVIVGMLALASLLTVASVVRLAAHARRDEIEIMQLVGAPLTYVRGPLVVEGVLQGGAGAVVGIVALGGLLAVARMQYGPLVAEAFGGHAIRFLPIELCAVLLVGGMLLGCIGGLIVAADVR